jgi:NAD(P)-dependent dehydrogenase (short-subunit alcohol dehydrogenase family)
MIQDFQGKTAVLTGAGSGFGLECARIGAARGMNLVLVDVQPDALARAEAEMQAAGVPVMARQVDVSDAAQMEVLAADVKARFGAPHFVFNNAGVGAGGLVWENTMADWDWVLGVDLWGVIHGVRLFVPMMLEAAAQDPRIAATSPTPPAWPGC